VSDNEESPVPRSSDARIVQVVTLRMQCYTWAEIAAELRVTVRTVYELRREHGLDVVVEQMQAEVAAAAQEEFVRAARNAFRFVAVTLEKGTADQQQWAASRMLDFMSARGDGGGQQIVGQLGARYGRRPGRELPPGDELSAAITRALDSEDRRGD